MKAIGIAFYVFIRVGFGFLEFLQKSPGSHAQPARRHKRQSHFSWVSFMNRLTADEHPLGDANWEANFC